MIVSGRGDCPRAVGRVRPGPPSRAARLQTFAGGLFALNRPKISRLLG
jgi:hypothetical protein